jgi:RNA polymerase sigma-70 factor (sigma-E family)
VTRSTRRDHTRDEFEQFVAECSADLLKTAALVVWDTVAAEDLVQECLFKVARRWPRVRAMEHPRAYARRVLINLALDGAARRQRHRSELDGRDRATVEDHHDEQAALALVRVEASSQLIDALGALAPRQRAALVLRYFDDLSEAQTAEILSCSVGTVKSTTSRALARLRMVMAAVPPEHAPLAATHLITTQGDDDGEPAIRS